MNRQPTRQPIDLSDVTLPGHDGGTLTFADYRGRRAVLVLGNQRNAKQVPAVAGRIHGAADTADVTVIQVAHLKGVPRAFRRLAAVDIKRGMRGQLTALREQRTGRGLPAADADDLLVMGLDWSGELTDRFGFTARDDEPAALLIDEQCRGVTVPADADLPGTVRSFIAPPANL
ncbi:hypothetical protein DY218_31055 [Streptomyces triticagri]|uniref:Uncharacterized protein n=1 Tax=Streptomyces triticagri TaxID=2293568 RepID=A0A372LVU4_9ACTN|nr:hypothetical protein [Streptomyces triticagri]RFU82788.1 hypothetical protein DY218_31055 [Streptomyces triticagri]